jgi:peptidoglycan/xylan/chitin deacetylase (PgdA/CDA1 family)
MLPLRRQLRNPARFIGPALLCLGLAVGEGSAQTVRSPEVIRSGPSSCKAIAFTFDMCPVRNGSGYDEGLINLLIQRHIPATFFLSGRWIETHREQVRAMLAVPFFEIGTHGQVHDHLPLLDASRQRSEILGPVQLLRTVYGHEAALFRPPYGEYDDLTVEVARSLGLTFILWDRVSGDPDPRLSRTQIVERLAASAKNGNIIVFHANGKGRHTQQVVADLYQELAVARGLRPVTVTELLGSCRPEAGRGQPQSAD